MFPRTWSTLSRLWGVVFLMLFTHFQCFTAKLEAKTRNYLKLKGKIWKQSCKRSRIFSLYENYSAL